MCATETTALIIGSGFGGVAMAIELRRAGINDFLVLERAAGLGGVWRENTYPGAGCDVPTPLYSFSFTRDPGWPRRYSGQPDILSYLVRTAETYGVLEHVRLGHDVTAAEFDQDTATWRVRTAEGREFITRVLIPATGQLSRPAYPALDGIGDFRGTSFHSAEWDHDCDLHNTRVAVIGTGASAIQFVPRIQPRARRLTVFQRSAQYILPQRDRVYSARYHRLVRFLPVLRTLDRLGFWLYAELAQMCLTRWQGVTSLFRAQTERHRRRQVRDPRLRRLLTPDYPLGCKRMLFSNDYLPSVQQPNVDLVTEAITDITAHGVRTADGVEHPVDVIIYGTGFTAQELLAPMTVSGIGGHPLSETWREGPRAYLGVAVPRFPNMFLLYGPNTNLGGGSIIHMLESQARYIRRAIRLLGEYPGHYLDVRAEAEQRWDAEIQHRLHSSVWSRCSNWYRNEHGRVTSNWPGRTGEYRRRLRHLDLDDFRLLPAGTTTAR